MMHASGQLGMWQLRMGRRVGAWVWGQLKMKSLGKNDYFSIQGGGGGDKYVLYEFCLQKLCLCEGLAF